MNASRPYGASTRPYYIGQTLSQTEDVFHIGYDCSQVSYCQALSIHSKSIIPYIKAIQTVKEKFNPSIIYAHESFPAIAAYFSVFPNDKPHLVFDIHALHAYEYKTMVRYYKRRFQSLFLFIKSYYPQRLVSTYGKTIIAASEELKDLLRLWYKADPSKIYVVPNGAPPHFLNAENTKPSPYKNSQKNALLIAPKNMMPNELAVSYMIQVAKILGSHPADKTEIQISIVGGGWSKEDAGGIPNIKFLGFVEDILPYIDHSDICLLPYPKEAVCGGARNKALDYFSRKKLVLSTKEGLRGLSSFKNGEHVLISEDDPREFAQKVNHAIYHPEIYRRLGENAYSLTNIKYNWQVLGNVVKNIFHQIHEKN